MNKFKQINKLTRRAYFCRMFLQFGACSDSVTPKYATAENSFFLKEMILWNYLDTSSMLSLSYHNKKNFNMDSQYANYFLLWSPPHVQNNGPPSTLWLNQPSTKWHFLLSAASSSNYSKFSDNLGQNCWDTLSCYSWILVLKLTWNPRSPFQCCAKRLNVCR